jgi:2,3-bisphosphoglycerate-independent phosphoglycerate mutase
MPVSSNLNSKLLSPNKQTVNCNKNQTNHITLYNQSSNQDVYFSKRVLLTILDGFGIDEPDKFSDEKRNPITEANVPNYTKLLNANPHTQLDASGWEVGLPKGQMGNSEVGHLNLGAGRIVNQDIVKIDKAIADGSLDTNPVLLTAIENAKKIDADGKQTRGLHLMGLVSDGGVHSHNNHLKALIKLAKKEGVENVYVHAFLDGRDTPPRSGIGYVNEINETLKECGYGEVSSVMGRYYAMDRDKRWERVEKAYNNLLKGEGNTSVSSEQAIKDFYDKENKGDEFVTPTAIGSKDAIEKSRIKNDDSIIFFNFRSDRAKEMTKALTDKDFKEFTIKNEATKQEEKHVVRKLQGISYVCMTKYDDSFTLPIAFPKEDVKNTLGETLSRKGIKQFRTAETEKFAHITNFFNGGKQESFVGEDRHLVPSPKVATYDLQPEMSAEQVKNNVIKALIEEKDKDFILVNFANPDMVGHTGKYDASVSALKTVDKCVQEIADAAEETGTSMIITADHGNVEKMKGENGEPYTAHTTNKVPFIVIDNSENKSDFKLRDGGCLADVAPTVLDLMEVDKPAEMTGKSLITSAGEDKTNLLQFFINSFHSIFKF